VTRVLPSKEWKIPVAEHPQSDETNTGTIPRPKKQQGGKADKADEELH